MILSPSSAEKFYKYGEAVLVGSSLLVGGVTIAGKLASRYQSAGEVPSIDKRLTHVEHEARFLVKGMEKLTHSKFQEQSGFDRDGE